jgi:hypothetical protein
MKKLLPIIFVALILVGCNKKRDPTPDPVPSNSTLIIGKWKDGVSTSIYYKSGKETYRENFAAPNTLAGYYEFTTAGQLSFYNLVGTVATLSGSYNYTLTNSGTVLHLTVGTTSTDSAIAFPDNNTLNITSTTIATVSYTVNGVLSYGDKQVDISTLIRL